MILVFKNEIAFCNQGKPFAVFKINGIILCASKYPVNTTYNTLPVPVLVLTRNPKWVDWDRWLKGDETSVG